MKALLERTLGRVVSLGDGIVRLPMGAKWENILLVCGSCSESSRVEEFGSEARSAEVDR